MTEILGCDVCRDGIYSAGQPRFIFATTATDLLYRCEECQTWWIGDGRSAHPVRDEVARERFPKEVSG